MIMFTDCRSTEVFKRQQSCYVILLLCCTRSDVTVSWLNLLTENTADYT